MKPTRIVVFTCNWNAYSGLEAAGRQHQSYSPNVRPIKVMCLGRLSPGIILKSFEKGAAGVLLLGCPPDECQYDFGFRHAEEMINVARGISRLLGFCDEQLKIDYIAAGDGRNFVKKVKEFVAGLENLN